MLMTVIMGITRDSNSQNLWCMCIVNLPVNKLPILPKGNVSFSNNVPKYILARYS